MNALEQAAAYANGAECPITARRHILELLKIAETLKSNSAVMRAGVGTYVFSRELIPEMSADQIAQKVTAIADALPSNITSLHIAGEHRFHAPDGAATFNLKTEKHEVILAVTDDGKFEWSPDADEALADDSRWHQYPGMRFLLKRLRGAEFDEAKEREMFEVEWRKLGMPLRQLKRDVCGSYEDLDVEKQFGWFSLRARIAAKSGG